MNRGVGFGHEKIGGAYSGRFLSFVDRFFRTHSFFPHDRLLSGGRVRQISRSV